MIDLNPIYRFFFQLSRAARSHHIDPLLVIERGVKRLPEWKTETGGLEAREAYSKWLKRHLKQRFTCRSFSRSFVFFLELRIINYFWRILCGMRNFSLNDFDIFSEGVDFIVELLACISLNLMCFYSV